MVTHCLLARHIFDRFDDMYPIQSTTTILPLSQVDSDFHSMSPIVKHS